MGMMMRKRFRKPFRKVKRHSFLPLILKIQLAAFIVGLSAGTPAIAADPGVPSDPGGYFHRAFFGILAHDVGGLWSGTRMESGVDINGEIVFGPCGPIWD